MTTVISVTRMILSNRQASIPKFGIPRSLLSLVVNVMIASLRMHPPTNTVHAKTDSSIAKQTLKLLPVPFAEHFVKIEQTTDTLRLMDFTKEWNLRDGSK